MHLFCSLIAIMSLAVAPLPAYVASRDVSSWIGSPLPFAHCVVGSAEIQEDRWSLLMFSSDCPACVNVIDSFKESADNAQDLRMKFAAVDFAGPLKKSRDLGGNLIFMSSNCLGRVKLPIILVVEEGVVIAAISPIDFGEFDESLAGFASD